jgi:tetratricopeptide (TPR) repeat protein
MHDAAAYAEQSRRNHRALEVLRSVLDSLPADGRRHSVLLVSRGFVDTSDQPLYQGVLLALQRSQAALYFLDVRQAGVREVADEGHAHDEGDEASLLQQHLGVPVRATGEWLSAETGGTTLRNPGPREVARVVDESREYYLLGYEPPEDAPPAGFRRIAVEVARPGLRVRARRGYDAAAALPAAAVHEPLRRALASAAPVPPAPAPPDAADEGQYLALVERYRRGDGGAIEEVLDWPAERVRRATDALHEQPPSGALAGAALLHLQAAGLERARRRPDAAARHLAVADRLAARCAGAPPQTGGAFRKGWPLATGTLLMTAPDGVAPGVHDARAALERLESAQRLAPDDPEVALALGSFHEAEALAVARGTGLAPGLSTDLGRAAPAFTPGPGLARHARVAQQYFRKALDLDPALDEARLRLAGVLQFRGDRGQAARELERVAAGSGAPAWASLAHLFLGDIDERAGRPESAIVHYRRAVELTPSGQSARIALSQALFRAGAAVEARRVMSEALAGGVSTAPDRDGWAAYRLSPLMRFLALARELRAVGCP